MQGAYFRKERLVLALGWGVVKMWLCTQPRGDALVTLLGSGGHLPVASRRRDEVFNCHVDGCDGRDSAASQHSLTAVEALAAGMRMAWIFLV